MDTSIVTATDFRTNAADILNRVMYEKRVIRIERHGKAVAKIMPIDDAVTISMRDKLMKSYGAIPDFPDVKKFRRNKRHWRTL
ncbi:type II toxin-antitoxin system Phd/YefM family antitoxin [Candidatus Gottesmanbacteria bacterium]|nr:type II toxin-antitoxin system Phd/YefM family antitoxin [Candidatus Gottesmanbacteria bacterium]